MAEVNRLCAPVYVYQEDVSENAVSARRKRDSFRELSRAPVTCLVGSISSLSEMTSGLPVLQRPNAQISSQTASPESAASGRRQKSLGVSKSTEASEQRTGGLSKMAELYQYPQLGDAAVCLPYHTSYSTIVVRVVHAQRHLAHKPSLKAEFWNILSSPAVECFVISSFWWLFLHNFQPDRKTQDLLFHRIAEHYIRILTENLYSRNGRAFLQAFPRTLSQMLYCCFCTCFPQSRSLREQSFLTALCSTAYQWTGAIRPAPEVYHDWDLEALQVTPGVSGQDGGGSSLNMLDSVYSSTTLSKRSIPSEHGSLSALQVKNSKCISERSQTSVVHSQSKITPTSLTRIHKGKELHSENITGSDLKAFTDPANCRPTRELEVRRSVFNVCGNSPLVQYYMTTQHRRCSTSLPLLVNWTEIHKPRPGDSPAYRDVLRQVTQRSTNYRREMHSVWAQYAQEIRNLQQKHLNDQTELHRKHKKILSQKSLIRRLCQLLMTVAKTEEEKKIASEQLRAFEMAVGEME